MRHAKPLHELQLAKIKRADIAAVLGSVAKNNGLVAHNRVRTGLATFFAWGMKQGIIEANPVVGTARHKEHSRERVLAPTELRAIWNALGEDRFASIIKLLALTGQRAGEISGLRWSGFAVTRLYCQAAERRTAGSTAFRYRRRPSPSSRHSPASPAAS